MGDAVALGTAVGPRLPGRALRVLKDETLATKVTGGSDDAFAVLYRRHHQAIYRYCLSLLRQEADARDALQSSMLAALSSLRASPIEGAFRPWLFRIAHNESVSIIRDRARVSPAEGPAEVASSDDPETREELRTLVSDLAALPERQRGALIMREFSGLSYAEIAAVLATSEAAGKQLVYEARSAMQDLREGHEMSCESVRERISARDGRLLRGRKVRSHLRGCQSCQDFERGIGRRRTAFAALAPPLPALAATAVLQDIFGAGGTSGGLGAGGTAAATAGVASGGAPLAGTAVLKVVGAALLAGAVGVGAYEAGSAILGGPAESSSATVTESSERAGDRGARAGAERAASARGRKGDARTGTKGAGTKAAPRPGGPSSTSGDAPAGTGGTTGSGGSNPPGGGGGTVDPPPRPVPPPNGGGGSDVAPGTPPGHGGTPPGHGGAPPGRAGGDTPPGHLGNPGQGGGRP